MIINSKTKQVLKGLAHSIKPIIIIGKDGLSEGTIDSIKIALEHRELIKIKFNSLKEQKKILSKNIEHICNACIISIIGNTLILFKQNSDLEKRKIKI